MQLTTKIVNGQFQEFFGWQNMIEGVMISLTFTFYLVEHLEYDDSKLFYSNIIIKFSSESRNIFRTERGCVLITQQNLNFSRITVLKLFLLY